MATANLIQVGTPGPALSTLLGNNFATSSWTVSGAFPASVTMTTAGTSYNINSISLAPGTYAVVGLCVTSSGGTQTMYLSTSTGSSTNGWPIQTDTPYVFAGSISAIIKVAVTTTVYMNASNTAAPGTGQGLMFATKIN